MTCLTLSSLNNMTSHEAVTSPDVTGVTISLHYDAEETHPLQIKRRLTQRRHSMYTSLSDFTSQGFVPFLPEGLLKKESTPAHVLRSRDHHVTTSSRSTPERVRRKFSDADIDHLSYIYSNNFDPSKSPKSVPSKPRLGVPETVAGVSETPATEMVREEEELGSINNITSESDKGLFKDTIGRRASTVN